MYAITSFDGDRDYNEDYALAYESSEGNCYIVADGLGGHGKGEVASRLVCETAIELFHNDQKVTIEKIFDDSQEKLLIKQNEEHAQDAMKTTMNVIIVKNGNVIWGHVGDTRTYYFKGGKIVSRTKDHSVPQMMVSMGEIKEKDIRHHPDRNRLLRVMGIEWNKSQYVIEEPIKVKKKQLMLMCTDGFWENIEEKDMEKCLKKAKSPQEWLDLMNEIVKTNGQGTNMDNYTAMAVWL